MPYSIFGAAVSGNNPGDGTSVMLGCRFQSSTALSITGVRFYKDALNIGTHIGYLWDNAGSLLAQVTFTGESASGWQEMLFASPVTISASTTYVVSYRAPFGNYQRDFAMFAAAGYSVNAPPLSALQDGADGLNGAYTYAAGDTFPDQNGFASNYYVDVIGEDTGGGDVNVTVELSSAVGNTFDVTPSPGAVTPTVTLSSAIGNTFDVTPIPGAVTVGVDLSSAVGNTFDVTPQSGVTTAVTLSSAVGRTFDIVPIPGAVTVGVDLSSAVGNTFDVTPLGITPITLSSAVGRTFDVTPIPGGIIVPVTLSSAVGRTFDVISEAVFGTVEVYDEQVYAVQTDDEQIYRCDVSDELVSSTIVDDLG